ncbi:shikimate kinase [Nocardiopsis ansamitocini]|uniref:Shikimate kinase n=1 Tax=Nocardiopsis ansamitocini TaxID=1670832 RepID=A0A9W6UGY6_9ACTN|nr:shikimate kinase [Nocardiopsis ansamitocini]GLU45994.1 shikimate kinase [Nocardiopsis ansamitocini]
MGRPRAVLIGSPGAGKTTVGQALAERLGVAFTDTDIEIEARAGKPIGDIFIEDGEPAFRALERAAVVEALRTGTGIVALGGGAVLDAATRTDLVGHHVVYLQVEFTDAAKRVGLNQARPLLTGNPRARLKSLLEERLPVYEGLAVHTVPTSGYHPDEVVDHIVETLVGVDG